MSGAGIDYVGTLSLPLSLSLSLSLYINNIGP
jgi:hypothetical protein